KQVLEALYELLRGFQSADDMAAKKLLEEVLKENPDQIYNGLLSVLMRLVFLLYAEDQGLMPDSDVYTGHYSVHGLFQRLRNDAEQFPDTMEHRYGAWAQLLALFRLVYQGSRHKLLQMPAREGHLFDPSRYPFLEGRSSDAQYDPAKPLRLPLVPDGTVFRVLEKLLVLEGERLSYRTLDVEQIGSVYETMIGFHLQRAAGVSIALKPGKSHGAPVPVNLEELLQISGDKRKAAIKEQTDYELTAKAATAVKSAESIDDLLIGLESRIARGATPQPVSAGTMLLVPSDERRRSGSHYTPRSLTEPIVRTTLEPILRQLGEQAGGGESSTNSDAPVPTPTPNAILDLKICDPAMGSGAFLVEACRQLAEALVDSWAAHGYKPYIPPDEDELLHARRLVAQRCLYGVDRNPMAVDLAKLSLWLATLAKDHPFTFVDHTLRCGDSLVGLTRKQIVGFDLNPSAQLGFVEKEVRDRMNSVANQRKMILDAGDNMLPGMKLAKLKLADEALSLVRLAGDAVVAAFFAADKSKQRKEIQTKHFESLEQWIQKNDFNARSELTIAIESLSTASQDSHSILPFHWEIEFPEVFARENSGFDSFVGNPPFAGKNTLIEGNHKLYLSWLQTLHVESHGNSDLVAHFFRRVHVLLREGGTCGLIATNTIGQGDTRTSGLQWICKNGGVIYSAQRRFKWPGLAAVIVSVVWISKGRNLSPKQLDGNSVSQITAFLFHGGRHENPMPLRENIGWSIAGTYVLGPGFVFEENAENGKSSDIVAMEELIASSSKSAEVIFPYLGGEDVNSHPTQLPSRFVINFGRRTLEECQDWPEVLAILE
ncbi:MAG: Eco57I restriction-modification methylase domain-containing protein, partial [Pirellula sp.]